MEYFSSKYWFLIKVDHCVDLSLNWFSTLATSFIPSESFRVYWPFWVLWLYRHIARYLVYSHWHCFQGRCCRSSLSCSCRWKSLVKPVSVSNLGKECGFYPSPTLEYTLLKPKEIYLFLLHLFYFIYTCYLVCLF